jgi:hypothetical protein
MAATLFFAVAGLVLKSFPINFDWMKASIVPEPQSILGKPSPLIKRIFSYLNSFLICAGIITA